MKKTDIILIGLIGILSSSVVAVKLSYNEKIKINSKLTMEYNRIYLQFEEYEKELLKKGSEIEQLNLALKMAFTDNKVIQTLLNQSMEEWTPETVLATRSKLASLPYGSWFEGGHYVTAAWGSKLLVGTHWGKSGHLGVDTKPLSGNPREPIKSVIDGRVVTWGRGDRLFGNYLVIESLDGQFQIKLAHLSSIAIVSPAGKYELEVGLEFKAGARIATMGDTGNTTGPHLHAEYYISENGTWRLLDASAILDYMGNNEIKE